LVAVVIPVPVRRTAPSNLAAASSQSTTDDANNAAGNPSSAPANVAPANNAAGNPSSAPANVAPTSNAPIASNENTTANNQDAATAQVAPDSTESNTATQQPAAVAATQGTTANDQDAASVSPTRPSAKALGKRPAVDNPPEEPSRPKRSSRFSGKYTEVAPGHDAEPEEPDAEDFATESDDREEFVLDADDAGIQVGKPKHKKRTAVTQASISSSVADVRKLVELENKFLTVVDIFEAGGDPDLAYADSLRLFLAETSLLRYVAPYERPEAAQLLSDFISKPVPPNARAWTVEQLYKSQQDGYPAGHCIRFVTGTTRMEAAIPYVQLPKDHSDFNARVNNITSNVLAILKRWPYGLPDTSILRTIIREVAHIEVGIPKLVNLPRWEHGRKLGLTIEHIDPATRQRTSHQCILSPGVMEDVDIDAIPSVGQNCKFSDARGNAINIVEPQPDQDGNMVIPSRVPLAEGLNGQKAEKFLRYFAYRTHGQIVSKQDILAQYDDLLCELGAKDRGKYCCTYHRSLLTSFLLQQGAMSMAVMHCFTLKKFLRTNA
jgi:hypothetical protein